MGKANIKQNKSDLLRKLLYVGHREIMRLNMVYGLYSIKNISGFDIEKKNVANRGSNFIFSKF